MGAGGILFELIAVSAGGTSEDENDDIASFIALICGIGGSVLMSRARGGGNREKGDAYFTASIALVAAFIVLSVPVVINCFVNGEGQVMDAGAVPWYAIFATSVCLGLSLYNRIQYKKTNCTSTMLRAESQTNLIDGLQSAGVGIAFLIFQLIPIESAFGFLHYTGDFFITLVLIVISVKDPVILLLDSF